MFEADNFTSTTALKQIGPASVVFQPKATFGESWADVVASPPLK